MSIDAEPSDVAAGGAASAVEDGPARGSRTVGRDVHRLRRGLESLIGIPATEGNKVDVLRNGVEVFPAVLEAIA